MRGTIKRKCHRPGGSRFGRSFAAILLLTALPLLAQYDPALQDQDRGNRAR